MSNENNGSRLPLTGAQLGVWYALQLHPGTTAYDIGGYAEIRGPLDPDLLEAAAVTVVVEAESLRARFDVTDGAVSQSIVPGLKPPTARVDLSGALDPAAAARAWLAASFTEPRDPLRDPLAEFTLLRLGPDLHWWCPRAHHLVLDGYSMPLVCARIADVYRARSRGLPDGDSPFRPYRLLIEADAAYRESAGRRADQEFWAERAGAGRAVPTLSGRGPQPPGPFHRSSIEVPFASAGTASWGETALAAFAAWLSRLTGSPEVSVGIPFTARAGALLRVPGDAANVLPLHVTVPRGTDAGALTAQTAAALAAARRHQRYRGEDLARTGPIHGPSVNLKYFDYRLDFGTAVAELHSIAAGPVDDLTLSVRRSDTGLLLDLDANAGAYGRAETDGLLRSLGEFLAAFDGPLDSIDLAGTASARAAGGQSIGRPLPASPRPSLTDAFAAQAATTPDAIALHDRGRTWTFAALHAEVERLAAALRTAGAGPESLIALALPRSADVVVAMLAVARAGAAWLPLDLSQPADRLDFMLRDATPFAMLVPDSASRPIDPPPGIAVLPVSAPPGTAVPADFVPAGTALPAPPGTADPADFVSSGNAVAAVSVPSGTVDSALPSGAAEDARLAYAIYTSGSTGRPKAVQVSQGALASLLAGHRDGVMARVPAGRRLRIAHTAPLSFDAALDPLLWMVAGHELVLVPEDVYRDPAALVRLVRDQRIDYVDTTPGHLTLLLDAGLLDPGVHHPSVLVFGGEAAPAALWSRLRAMTDPPVSINAYGPTEYTVDALHASVGDADRPVLGAPIAGARALVLDDALRLVPEGGVGELYVGGPGLARGYAGQAGRTAARFVADPCGPPGARLFRTGDRVRLRVGGAVEYLGRADDQVKIRGFRVEPGETEAVLAAHPLVAHAVVVPRESAGGTVLVAYVVPVDAVPRAALDAYLRERLPDYLVPTAIVPLDALPMTLNGKLDLHALPAPETTATGRAPRGPVEETLAGIIAELLDVREVGVDDDFFALGGHSLTAARLLTLVRTRLGVELDLRAVFAGRTLAALARTVEESRRTARPALTGGSAGERTPLSPAQRRFWFADRLDDGSAVYNIPLVVTLDGRVDADTLRAALRDVAVRHETLRTVVAEDADGPWQRVLDEPGDLLTVHDAGAATETLIDRAVREPFDLAHRPPLRAVLLRGPDADTLVVVLHHLAGDQTATGVLRSDLAACYEARTEGRAPALAPLTVRYRDYTRWHATLLAQVIHVPPAEDRLAGDGPAEHGLSFGERQLGFWRRVLSGLPAEVPLARDRARPAEPASAGAVHRAVLDARSHARLREFARHRGVTTFAALHTATVIVLDAFGAGPDLPMGTPIAARPDPALDAVVGCFLNTVVLRADLTGEPTVAALLDRVQRADAAAFAHADLPFERVVEALNPPREPGRHPLFQLMIIHEYAQDETLRLGDVSGRARLADTGTAKFDLTVKFTERADGIDVRVEYATALFDAGRIEALSQALLTVLSGLPEHSHSRLSRLPVLPGTAWDAGHGPDVEVPDTTLPALFAAAAGRHADRTALVDDATGRRLTYAELDAEAARVAAGLRARGAGPGTIVAVEVPRSVELIVALYAVHKAGAAYLPLDPDHPAERTALMLDDARPVVHLHADTVRGLAAAPTPGRPATPGDAAYVIYTSGSTGRPKGVVVPHRAIVNRLLWMQHAYPLDGGDVVLQKTPAGFDVSVWEFFWPLLTGATLVLAAPGGHRDPGYLVDVIARHRVTTLHFVPSMLGAFLTDPRAGECEGVRRVFCSGEALPGGLVARFRATLPAELHNLYGPTEAAVDVTAWRTGDADTRTPAPIGRPVWNTGAHVLDHRLRPAPAGVPGELYLSGVQLATGYLGRAALTATRFVAHPRVPGERLYRTGDLARRRVDGAVDYLGRADDQVKVRGVRIELGEVEAALQRHPGVRASAATTRIDRAGNARLLGFVVPAPGAVLAPDAVRTWLGTIVPDALVPSTIRVLDSLPLTPSGKLDRRALPVTPPDQAVSVPPPVATAQAGAVREPDAVAVVRHVFAEVLDRADVDPDTGFFAAGGDSILAIQLVNRARAAGLRIGVKDVFAHQSPAALAAVAEPLVATETRPPAETGPEAEGPVELTPIMHRLRERGGLGDAVQSATATMPPGTDLAALTAAVETLLGRHPMLRVRLTISDHGHWSLAVPPRAETPPAGDLVRIGADDRDAAIRALIRESAATLDPRAGRNSSWCLIPAGDGGSPLVVAVVHHLAVDTVSWGILWADLRAALAGTPLPATRPLAFRAWSARLRELASAPAMLSRYGYWRDVADAAAPILPPAGGSVHVGHVTLSVEADVFAPLWEWAVDQFGFSGEDLVLAAVVQAAAALHAGDAQRDVTVAVERHGRDDEATFGTVGWFTSLYPVRLAAGAGVDPVASLKAVKETLRAVPDGGLGYGLLRYLNPQTAPGLAATPEPELLVNYLGNLPDGLDPDVLGDGGPHERGAELVAWTVDGRALRAVLLGAESYDLARFRDALGAAFAALSEATAWAAGGRTPSDLMVRGLSQADVDGLDADHPGWLDVVPAGPLQEGLVALAHTAFGDAEERPDVYTVQLRLRFRTVPDAARMRAAVEALFARHVGLRLGLRPVESGRVVAVLHPPMPVELREHRDRDVDALAGARRRERFDLARPPLFRFDLVAGADGAGTLIITGHHAAWDGWSAPLLVNDLLALYSGRPPAPDGSAAHLTYLRDLATRDAAAVRDAAVTRDAGAVRDAAVTRDAGAVCDAAADGPDAVNDRGWGAGRGAVARDDAGTGHGGAAGREAEAGTGPEGDRAAWRTLLDGLDGPTLLVPGAATAGDTLPAEVRVPLPEELGDALRRRAGARGLTLNTLLQGAWGLVLARRTGRTDTTFGITVSGRPPEIDGLDRAIGLFVNTVPARCETRAGDTFGDVLARLQQRQAATAAHHRVGLAAIQRGLGTLFDTLLVFENYPLDEAALLGPAGGADAGLVAIEADDATHYPVTLTVFPGDEIGLALGYRPDLLDADAAHAFLAELRDVLELFAAGLSEPVTLADVHPMPSGPTGVAANLRPSAQTATGVTTQAVDRADDQEPGRSDSRAADPAAGQLSGHVDARVAGHAATATTATATGVGTASVGKAAASGTAASGTATGVGVGTASVGTAAASGAVGAGETGGEQGGTAAERLAGIFADILEIPHAAPDDSFLALGGDSILAIQLVARARAAGLHFSAADVFTHRTAAALATAAAAPNSTTRPPAKDAFATSHLTPIMHWLRDLGGPIGSYSQSMRLRLPAGTTEQRLVQVIQRVLDRHPMLRARFDAGWRLTAASPGTVRAEDVLTVTTGDPGDATAEAAARLDPHAGVCTRWVLLRDSGTLLVVAHHLVIDGVSWRVLMADLAGAARDTPLPAPATGFDDWTALLATDAGTSKRAQELHHWQRALDAPPPFPGLSLDAARDTAATRRELTLSLDSSETEAVLALGAEDVLLAALVTALGDRPVSVLLEGHGRNDDVLDVDVSRTVGWFTSMYPVRLDGGDPARVAAARKAVPDHGLGYGQLRQLRRALHAPEPQVRFNYLGRFNTGTHRDFAPVDETEPIGGYVDPALPIPYPLDVTAAVAGSTLHLRLAWPGRHLGEPRMREFADSYLNALRHLSGGHAPDPDDAVLVDIGADELDDLWRNA
ncbi:amino acid adenylation domain-containing protein/non-ribosomal peptide synthase protein (TIGR01720 family) [Catenuloplanes nepalensis]|uniref:Amino acid adenylation domain-containing protein/non-ribosomal peptide synthase protein (TIGR01720 family) n=1 Tax=Catenuloplanes nepalensis TaxID=587533 RepID=A0ABT9MUB8_9ACTN|nr:non-ribosomal peptide synthetase [Catenuloplanes nepalensis]MDP9795024.1 amino acid adenylation domain-containing protein/non-ribosomal peptide synthase protein (TIGR01720 family) [Catenuloplanes nepalensis]